MGRAYREEEVTNIVRRVHGDPDVSEVEPVAQRNERQCHDVVPNKLLEVLPPLLQAEQHDDSLLGPVCSLEKVVELEGRVMRLVGVRLEHAPRVVVPHRRARHHPQAGGAHDAKVHGRVHLLHEALLLATGRDAGGAREPAEDLLHDELAREREDDCVEGDEGQIPEALAVLRGRIQVGAAVVEPVRGEDEGIDGVGLGRVGGVGGAEDGEEAERDGPGVLQGEVLAAAQERARLPRLSRSLVLARPTHRRATGPGAPAHGAILRRGGSQAVGWVVEDGRDLGRPHLGECAFAK